MNKIKTIRVYNDPAQFDNRVNTFCATEKVFATQTHAFVEDKQILYVAICFYGEK